MKKGDKVRFLNEKGGGIIAGFQNKNIVLIEDEDGFQIPTNIKDVIVIEDSCAEEKALSRIEEKEKNIDANKTNKSIKQQLSLDPEESLDNWRNIDADVKPDEDPSVGFKIPVQERIGGDKLSVYIAYVPIDKDNFSATRFESYIINDSNYYITFTYQIANESDNKWTLHAHGEVEPNTKMVLEQFGKEELNDLLRGNVQFIAYKQDKDFELKSVYDVQLKLDAKKFYNQNSFHENIFFNKPAILCTLVLDDKQRYNVTVKPEKYCLEVDTRKDSVCKPARIQKSVNKDNLETLQKHFTETSPISPIRKVKKLMREDKIIIDLHADSLLETIQGMTSADILEYQLDFFRKTLEEYKNIKGQKIIFIHGKGEGVLRQSLLHELNYRYKHYSYQDASFREYGYGATQVTIK